MSYTKKKHELAEKAKGGKTYAKEWLERKSEGYHEHGDRTIAGPKRFLQKARKHAGMYAMSGQKGAKYARQDAKSIGEELNKMGKKEESQHEIAKRNNKLMVSIHEGNMSRAGHKKGVNY